MYTMKFQNNFIFLQVIRLAHKNYLDIIENALSEGSAVLLENIGETVSFFLYWYMHR